MIKNDSIKYLVNLMHKRLVDSNQSNPEIEELYASVMDNFDCAILKEMEYSMGVKGMESRREFEKEDEE